MSIDEQNDYTNALQWQIDCLHDKINSLEEELRDARDDTRWGLPIEIIPALESSLDALNWALGTGHRAWIDARDHVYIEL
jgi:hypothetical protein